MMVGCCVEEGGCVDAPPNHTHPDSHLLCAGVLAERGREHVVVGEGGGGGSAAVGDSGVVCVVEVE